MLQDAQVLPNFIERIQTHMPETRVADLRYEAQVGCETDAVHIGSKHIALFARNPERFSLNRTLDLCDRIRDRISLTLPSAVAREADMAICPIIPGAPLQRHLLHRLPEKQRDRIADQLGDFLVEFQSVPVKDLVGLKLLERSSDMSRATVERCIDDFARQVGPYLMRPAATWIQEHCQAYLEETSDELGPRCLSHGELAPPHIFFDDGTDEVTGILDFDMCSIGEPADDLFWLIWSYGQSFVDRVVRGRPALERHYRRARFFTGYQLMRWTLTGVQENSPAWFATHLSFPFDFVPLRRDEE